MTIYSFVLTIIPIILHKPLRLEYFNEKLAKKIDDAITDFKDPTIKLPLNNLILLKKVNNLPNLSRLEYNNYVIGKFNELIDDINKIIE